MIIKRYLSYLLVGILLISQLTMTGYAASSNRISKVLTVMEGEVLVGENTSQLIMYLMDGLQEGDIFYLDLSGAQWLEEIHTVLIGNLPDEVTIELKRMTRNQLQVKVKKGQLLKGESLQIPMWIQMTGQTAYVSIKNNNTTVSSGTYLVAKAMSHLGGVYAEQIPTTTSDGIMADLYMEEPFSQAFIKAMAQGAKSTIQLRLNHNGFEFNISQSDIVLRGIKGFEGIDAGKEAIKQIDEQTLELILPDMSEARYTGGFILSGIRVEASDKIPALGHLTLTAQGDLVARTTLEVLEVTDYAIHLKADQEEVKAGSRQRIQFTLEEQVEHSLVKTRPTYFTFTGGAQLEVLNDEVTITLNGKPLSCEPIISQNKVIGFEIPSLPEGTKSYTFSVDLKIPAQVKGEVLVLAEGRSLIETLETKVLEVRTPFMAEVTPFELKVGVKDQVGGKVALSEGKAGEITQGESIVLKLEENEMKLVKAPEVTVTKGDLRLGTPRVVGDRIEIPVVRRSNEASTISIAPFTITVDRTVASGTYTLEIGGRALSALADETQLDPIWEGDFLSVGEEVEKPEEPTTYPIKVCFTIGKSNYTFGNETRLMDAAPFISNGRTLLPVKYVADALGISGHAILWEAATKTVTIMAKEKITLQIGSKTMKVGTKVYTMSAAPAIQSGRTFIPVAEITRALDIQTYWDAATKRVSFTTWVSLV